MTIKKGDLFYTSWGYDQTNYDYLVILEVSKSGKTCKARMTHSKHLGFQKPCNIQKPIFAPYSDTFTMRIKQGVDEPILRGSYPYSPNGSMENVRLDTFRKAKENEQFYETDSMFGH